MLQKNFKKKVFFMFMFMKIQLTNDTMVHFALPNTWQGFALKKDHAGEAWLQLTIPLISAGKVHETSEGEYAIGLDNTCKTYEATYSYCKAAIRGKTHIMWLQNVHTMLKSSALFAVYQHCLDTIEKQLQDDCYTKTLSSCVQISEWTGNIPTFTHAAIKQAMQEKGKTVLWLSLAAQEPDNAPTAIAPICQFSHTRNYDEKIKNDDNKYGHFVKGLREQLLKPVSWHLSEPSFLTLLRQAWLPLPTNYITFKERCNAILAICQQHNLEIEAFYADDGQLITWGYLQSMCVVNTGDEYSLDELITACPALKIAMDNHTMPITHAKNVRIASHTERTLQNSTETLSIAIQFYISILNCVHAVTYGLPIDQRINFGQLLNSITNNALLETCMSALSVDEHALKTMLQATFNKCLTQSLQITHAMMKTADQLYVSAYQQIASSQHFDEFCMMFSSHQYDHDDPFEVSKGCLSIALSSINPFFKAIAWPACNVTRLLHAALSTEAMCCLLRQCTMDGQTVSQLLQPTDIAFLQKRDDYPVLARQCNLPKHDVLLSDIPLSLQNYTH
jgi:hypothetical protein